jgi:hypothetical protein
MAIPIENIYFLLCYAWNKLDEKERVDVSIDDKTELLDLFAKVLKVKLKLVKHSREIYFSSKKLFVLMIISLPILLLIKFWFQQFTG